MGHPQDGKIPNRVRDARERAKVAHAACQEKVGVGQQVVSIRVISSRWGTGGDLGASEDRADRMACLWAICVRTERGIDLKPTGWQAGITRFNF